LPVLVGVEPAERLGAALDELRFGGLHSAVLRRRNFGDGNPAVAIGVDVLEVDIDLADDFRAGDGLGCGRGRRLCDGGRSDGGGASGKN
jgi:hypothetical protein